MIHRLAPLLTIFCISSAFADYKQVVTEQIQPLLVGKAIAGCVVGVIDNGKTEVYAFGSKQLDKDQAPDGDTIYEIGSMSKAFTGTLLADMANRGIVKLDDPVQSLLPADVKLKEFEGHTIRLVDLASQSSGLPRMPDNFAPRDAANPYADYTAENLYAFLRGYQLARAPGTYEYSNLGMGLLGHLLAQKAGKSYEDLLVERICTPLKMNDTRVKLNDDQKSRLAKPYNGDRLPEHNWDLDVFVAAGGIRSSVNDMLKLLTVATSGEKGAVTDALHKAWEQQIGPPENTQRVALAWHIAGDGVTLWHNGMTGGYSSVMFIHSPTKKAVVLLCNTATQTTTAAGEKIIQAMLGMKPAPVELTNVVEVKPEVLKRYAGAYDLAPGARFTITVEDGKLMVQLTGQPKFQVFAKSETEFFYRVVDAQLTFETNEQGEVERLILHQNGMNMPALRAK